MIKDITQEGPLSYRDLQLENNNFSDPIHESVISNLKVKGPRDASQKFASYSLEKDLTDEMIESGFGQSRHDKVFGGVEYVNENRALNQSTLEQIYLGLIKGNVIAATTAADAIVGTVAGIASGISYLSETANQNKEFDLKEFGKSTIYNPVSIFLQNINDWSEKVLPNYYTRDEIENPWKLKNVFSGNFLGDKVLKNLGFAVGAAIGGKVNAGAMSKALGMSKIRDVYRGAAKAAGFADDKIDDFVKALSKGDYNISEDAFITDLINSAKQLKNAEQTLKITGGLTAGMGEARIEAITNVKQYEDYHNQLIEDDYKKGLLNIENIIFEENPSYFDLVQEYDSNTEQLSYKKVLNDKGKTRYSELKNELDYQYSKGKEELAKEVTNMANIIFAANTLLLSIGDIWQFGRYYAGGFKSGKIVSQATKAGKENIDDIVKNGFKPDLSDVRWGKTKALLSPVIEGSEEMNQQLIAEASGQYQASRLNEFYGYKIDPDAEKEAISSLQAVSTGIKGSWGDVNEWQQFFIGALTSMMGIPGFNIVNANGKNKLKVAWQSEFLQGIKEANDQKAKIIDVTNQLNKAVQNPEFVKRFQSFIRHNAIQNDLDIMMEQGKEFNYKNLESAQFLNDALLFIQAGRFQELNDIIEQYGTVTLNDVTEIRQLSEQKDGTSIYSNKTDQEVVDIITERKNKYLEQAKKANNIVSSLKTLYGDSINNDTLEEITWNTFQIDELEKRGKSIFKELLDRGIGVENLNINNYSDLLTIFANEDDIITRISEIVNNKTLSKDEQNQQVQDIVSKLNKKLNNNRIATARAVKEAKRKGAIDSEIAEIKDQSNLENRRSRVFYLAKLTDMSNYLSDPENSSLDPLTVKELRDKQSDLIKILSERTNYIKKLHNLSSNPELFTNEAIAQHKEALRKAEDKHIESIVIKAISATNVHELSESLSGYEQYEDRILDKLWIEGNDNTKKIVKDYKELTKSASLLGDIFENKEHTPTTESAANVLIDAFENANSVTQAKAVVQEFLDDPNQPQEVKDEVSSVIKELEEHTKSSNSSKPDTNKNEGSRKETPKKGGSILDNLSDSPDEFVDEEEGAEDDLSGDAVKDEDIEATDEKFEDKKLEEKRKAREAMPTVHGSSQDNNGQKEYDSNTVEKKGYIQGLRSWIESLFDFTALKEATRKLIRRINPITTALDELGVYDYVDSGKLADKLQSNPDLKIHLMTSPDSRLQGQVLLTIELEKGELNKHAITAQNGKNYQVVGVLGFNSANAKSKIDYKEISDRLHAEATNTTGYYVSDAYTKITHIYSGRMVKSDESNEVDQRTISRSFMRGREFHLGILYNEGNFKTPTIDTSSNPIVTPNTNNQNPRKGSVWLMSKEADGRYYPKAVTVKRFNPQEYSLDEYGISTIVLEIKKYLRTLLDPKASHQDKLAAKFALKGLLHFPAENDIVFQDNSSLVSIGNSITNIGNNEADLDKAVDNALNALYNSGLNLRFNIDTYRLGTDPDYSDMILDSGILSTDLLLPFNVNASFDVAPINFENGTPIEDNDYKVTGHTGNAGVNTTLQSNTFIFNGKTYRQVEGKSIQLEGYSGYWSRYIAQAIQGIMSGKFVAVPGDSNLFVFQNNDGSVALILSRDNGGGFRVLSSEEYLKRYSKVKERVRKENQQKAVEKIEEKKPEETPPPSETPEAMVDNLFGEMEYVPDEADSEEFASSETHALTANTDKETKPTNVTDREQALKKRQSVLNSDKSIESMEELGFDSILDLVEYCENNNLIDPRVITTQEEADALFNIIKNCR